MAKKSKYEIFEDMARRVSKCTRCPRMNDSARILSLASGSLSAPLMFVGEAPGRRGADQTMVPFHGDVSGNNFEELLACADISRDDIFVTNAVLCNPRDSKGNNSTPNRSEIGNCSTFLAEQIDLIDPQIVVTLGAVALGALESIEPHGLQLKSAVRKSHSWFGRELIALYHPGQRAMIHRSKANQRSDYQFVADRWRRNRTGHKPKRVTGSTPDRLISVCRDLIAKKGEVTYFQLHKYAYLIEYVHVKTLGHRLTSAHFIRQKDGPYCTDLHISKIRRADPSINILKRGTHLVLTVKEDSDDMFALRKQDNSTSDIVDEVLDRYTYASDADLKKAVYLTSPMRMILRREQKERHNLHNMTIDFLVA